MTPARDHCTVSACVRGADGAWLAFERPDAILECARADQVPDLLREVESAARAGRWAVGWVAYEAARAFDRAFVTRPPADAPAAWFALFDRPAPATLDDWPDTTHRAGPWLPDVERETYLTGVERVRERIAAGDVYQVNLTHRLVARFAGSTRSLFRSLFDTQPVGLAAWIDAGDLAICSASPELFFELGGGRIVSRPMKGTAQRGRTAREDRERAEALSRSEKDRAENLMIVDMVRNDLGRIARPGSVRVERLFEVERYATVLQMTSTVAAATGAGLAEAFAALFPAASITGAPKVSAMRSIADLESSPRGVYTGAIGAVTPGGEARFNVAIRTAVVDRRAGRALYGTGGGVVWDSVGEREWEECRAKAAALVRPIPRFELLETLLWEPGEGWFLLDRHLARLRESAAYFGFHLDEGEIAARLHEATTGAPGGGRRVRLRVDRSGRVAVEARAPDPAPAAPWRIALAAAPIDPSDPFLFHKTTHRAVYDRFRAEAPRADDVLLWRPDGRVTESTLANIAVRRDDRWITPPVACGLLAGTFRAELLHRGELEEADVTVDEVRGGTPIRLLNSLRRWIDAELT